MVTIILCLAALALGFGTGIRYSDSVGPKALVVKVALAFCGSILFSVLATPAVTWALIGAPDDGSHGFFIPLLLSTRIGIPAGVLLGTVLGLLIVLKSRRKSTVTPATSGVFEKYKDEE